MKKKFNVYKSSMFFYVCALLFMIGFGISFYNVTTYVSSLVEAGSLTLSTSWMSIVLYYISNTGLCLGCGIACIGFGYIIQLLKDMKKNEEVKEVFVEEVNNQEEKEA